MTKLFEVLYIYAAEHLVVKYQQETAAKIRTAQRKADELSEQLNHIAPGAEERVEELKVLWDTMNDYHSRAVFLAGLSIGLDLGRL